MSVDRKRGLCELLFSTKPNFNDGFYAKLSAADKNKNGGWSEADPPLPQEVEITLPIGIIHPNPAAPWQEITKVIFGLIFA